GAFDALVGINLLREGLDIPECALVAILDADKEGFLRSETSLVQTIGRAARNIDGRVILYADTVTGSMERAIAETKRRREKQEAFNAANGIAPESVRRDIADILESVYERDHVLISTGGGLAGIGDEEAAATIGHNFEAVIAGLETRMRAAPPRLDFEEAARPRGGSKRLRATELAVIDDPTAKAIAIARGRPSSSPRLRGESRPPQAGGVRDMREAPRKPTLDEMGPGPDKESKPYRSGPRSTSGRAGMRGGWRPPGREATRPPLAVVPAKAGTHGATYAGLWNMGSRFRGNDNGETSCPASSASITWCSASATSRARRSSTASCSAFSVSSSNTTTPTWPAGATARRCSGSPPPTRRAASASTARATSASTTTPSRSRAATTWTRSAPSSKRMA